MEIKVYNRQEKKIITEKVYGEKAVEWLYNTPSGSSVANILARKTLSQVYGAYQNISLSKNKINNFVRSYNIDLGDFLPEDGLTDENPYNNFNQFFIRRFKDGKRTFTASAEELAAPCEARYYAYDSLDATEVVPVKGKYLTAEAILNNSDLAKEFNQGPMLLARLCPVDYHRFHFPDTGEIIEEYPVHGEFHSVNPLALKKRPSILKDNERYVTILDTENFGKIAYVEVGAMMVGKIVQSHQGKKFNRGDEKGYFLFGGSTVMIFGQPGKWKPDTELVEHTKQGMETLVQLGERVGSTV